MITRLVISAFILSVLFFSNSFVGWAAVPQVCIDADRHIQLQIKIHLYTQCIHSGKLSENESSIIYTNRGKTYEHLGDNKLAIQDYDRAILTNPKFYNAYIKRGSIYYSLGNFKQAIQDFEKAIELRPNNSNAYNNLAWVLANSKDPEYRDGERALKLIQTAMQHSSIDDYRMLDTLAAVYAELGQFDRAIEVQSKLIKIFDERGEEDLSNKSKEVLSDYELNRKHY